MPIPGTSTQTSTNNNLKIYSEFIKFISEQYGIAPLQSDWFASVCFQNEAKAIENKPWSSYLPRTSERSSLRRTYQSHRQWCVDERFTSAMKSHMIVVCPSASSESCVSLCVHSISMPLDPNLNNRFSALNRIEYWIKWIAAIEQYWLVGRSRFRFRLVLTKKMKSSRVTVTVQHRVLCSLWIWRLHGFKLGRIARTIVVGGQNQLNID